MNNAEKQGLQNNTNTTTKPNDNIRRRGCNNKPHIGRTLFEKIQRTKVQLYYGELYRQ